MKTKYEVKIMQDFFNNEVMLAQHLYQNAKCKETKTLENILENNKKIVEVLTWILKDSEPKRTIFDLTEKELQELINMVNPLENNKIRFIEKEKKYVYIVTESTCFSIYDDLDIFLQHQSDSHAPRNQVKYIDRIREMLSKSKEELK